ncbi:hypothetical protein MAR_011661 [Mya arenaria]|uniref:Uncharacterized protein n=1 Tax=Mya arenaria TaxID=6604 RepID=A0ABY7FUY5_MYAAR|nr:hypothetical protein MAR_011661 [Mya arenaria]
MTYACAVVIIRYGYAQNCTFYLKDDGEVDFGGILSKLVSNRLDISGERVDGFFITDSISIFDDETLDDFKLPCSPDLEDSDNEEEEVLFVSSEMLFLSSGLKFNN